MKHLCLILSALFLLNACEQTVDTPDWPVYNETLVIAAFLRIEQDSLFTHVRVNRTLPLNVPFDQTRAMVNDAELWMDNGGDRFAVPRDESYYPYDFDFNYGTVTPRSTNEHFTLTVRQGDKTAYATIQTSEAATRFTSVDIRPTPGEYDAYTVRYTIPAPGLDAYTECVVEYYEDGMGYWYEMQRFTLPHLANRPDGLLAGDFKIWVFGRQGQQTRVRYTLTVRNKAYEDYVNSRWNVNTGDSPFDPPQKNPPFNVTGDGIGFFWYERTGAPVEIEY